MNMGVKELLQVAVRASILSTVIMILTVVVIVGAGIAMQGGNVLGGVLYALLIAVPMIGIGFATLGVLTVVAVPVTLMVTRRSASPWIAHLILIAISVTIGLVLALTIHRVGTDRWAMIGTPVFPILIWIATFEWSKRRLRRRGAAA